MDRLPEGKVDLHFRPHDAVICDDNGAGSLPLLVTNVYRKGGNWRVEGHFTGVARPVEVDLSSQGDAPIPGRRVGVRLSRVMAFANGG